MFVAGQSTSISGQNSCPIANSGRSCSFQAEVAPGTRSCPINLFVLSSQFLFQVCFSLPSSRHAAVAALLRILRKRLALPRLPPPGAPARAVAVLAVAAAVGLAPVAAVPAGVVPVARVHRPQ